MAHYEVFRDVGDSLVNLVKIEAERQKQSLEVLLTAPDKVFFEGRGNAVAVYLYNFNVDYLDKQRTSEIEVEGEDDQGVYTIVYPRALITRVHCAVVARGKTYTDELLTLSLALKAFAEFPSLDAERRLGENLPNRLVPVDFDAGFDTEAQMRLCSAMGVPFHPMLGYRIVTEIQPDRELRRTRKVERRSMELYDRNRLPDDKGPDAVRRKAATGKR